MSALDLCRWSQNCAQLLGCAYFKCPAQTVECRSVKEVPSLANCHTMLWPLVLPRLLSIGVEVVMVPLSRPRPCQHLSQELPAPGRSLRALALPCLRKASLHQDLPLYYRSGLLRSSSPRRLTACYCDTAFQCLAVHPAYPVTFTCNATGVCLQCQHLSQCQTST